MAEYHVGCGITVIWAETLNKKGDMWLHKSNVTDEAFNAVAQYCLEHNEALSFDYKGKRYRLEVTEIKSEGEDLVEDDDEEFYASNLEDADYRDY